MVKLSSNFVVPGAVIRELTGRVTVTLPGGNGFIVLDGCDLEGVAEALRLKGADFDYTDTTSLKVTKPARAGELEIAETVST